MQHRSAKILAINPNSNTVYTECISKALEPVRQACAANIDCMTLYGAPLAIESDEDIDAVIEPICETIKALDFSVDGVIIACFADPGLREARRAGSRLIVGSCEAAVFESMNHGSRLGLLSTGDDIDADRELVLSYGPDIEFLAIESLGIPTADIPTDPTAMQKIVRCGENLQAQNVDAIMLGCAGMAAYAAQLNRSLDVPVIESVAAAAYFLIETIKSEEFIDHAKNQSTATA